MAADLHTHSTASDGRSTPAELVQEAKAAGLRVFALTDHDSWDGLDEARQAAADDGPKVLAGAEISTQSGPLSVHLLAYGDLRGDAAVQDMCAQTITSRASRVEAMARRVAAGEGLDEKVLLAQLAAATPPGATPGRPHLADALVAMDIVMARDDAFIRLLADAGPYYVHYGAPSTAQAVAAVRAAGGVAVLAHPRGRHGAGVLSDSRIADLAEVGLAGLEVDHRDHDDSARYGLRMLARDLDLITTGSSDYHGSGKKNRLGENTTDAAAMERIESLLNVEW